MKKHLNFINKSQFDNILIYVSATHMADLIIQRYI